MQLLRSVSSFVLYLPERQQEGLEEAALKKPCVHAFMKVRVFGRPLSQGGGKNLLSLLHPAYCSDREGQLTLLEEAKQRVICIMSDWAAKHC